MERILSLAGKVSQDAEVFMTSAEETQARFEANRLKQLQTNQTTIVALRIIRDGKIGYATTTDAGNAEELVNNAVETAEFGMKAEFRFPEKQAFPAVDIYDPGVNAVPVPDMVRIGDEMIAAITRHTKGIMCEAGVGRGIVTVRSLNSRGGQAEYTKSFFGIDIEGNLIDGTDMLFVGESASSCHPLTDAESVVATILRQLELASRRAKVTTGEMPVIFTPNGVTSLLIPLMSAFNGKTVLEGASPLGDKVGKPAFDPHFTLHDNPLLPFRPGSRPCDDEGVAGRVTPLAEKGIVKGFLYDLQTAARAGTESTGNGTRGRGSLPSPSATALVVEPGTATFDEMVKDIREGLVIEQLMGSEQGNILGGDFSGNVLLGYKVENGEIVGRVKDTMVSGNAYRILNDIAAIGSESKWVGSFLSAPPLYCKKLSVSSKG